MPWNSDVCSHCIVDKYLTFFKITGCDLWLFYLEPQWLRAGLSKHDLFLPKQRVAALQNPVLSSQFLSGTCKPYGYSGTGFLQVWKGNVPTEPQITEMNGTFALRAQLWTPMIQNPTGTRLMHAYGILCSVLIVPPLHFPPKAWQLCGGREAGGLLN